MGYFLAVSATKLELYKHNYDSELLHSVKVSLKANEPTSLRIEAVRGTIRVYVQGGEEPILTYDDPSGIHAGESRPAIGSCGADRARRLNGGIHGYEIETIN